MESQQDELNSDLTHSKSHYRRSERNWMSEKETLHRKIQFLQNFGPSSDGLGGSELATGGFFTDQRSAYRAARGGDAKLQKQIQKLNVSSVNPITKGTNKKWLSKVSSGTRVS